MVERRDKTELQHNKLDIEGFHFQKPDISVIGDNFQPYNKKLLGYPGRNKKLDNILNLDLKEVWNNLRRIQNTFESFLSVTGNFQQSIDKLNEDLTMFPLFEISDIDLSIGIKISGISIYANEFYIENDSSLHFYLTIPNAGHFIDGFIDGYFIDLNLGMSKKRNFTKYLPCNEPIITEYISAILYAYKQYILFTVYGYQNKTKRESNGKYNMSAHTNIKISKLWKNESNIYMDTLIMYLKKNNPNISIQNQKVYIDSDRFFRLEIKDSLEISFYNTPFELAEYWLQKIDKEVKQVNNIINAKYKLIDNINKTKKNLIDTLEPMYTNWEMDENGTKIKRKYLEEISQKIQNYKKKWDYVESDIYIKFLEDIQYNIDSINISKLENLNLLLTSQFQYIVEYYETLINREIRWTWYTLFPKHYSTEKEQEGYIISILNLLEKIDNLYPERQGVKKILPIINSTRKGEVMVSESYISIGKAVLKWTKNKNSPYYDEFNINFAKWMVVNIDIPHLSKLIIKWNIHNIQDSINSCLDKYNDCFSSETISLVEASLWNYCLTNTIYHYYFLIDNNNLENIDFSIFDQFIDKPIYGENLAISNTRIEKYEYKSAIEHHYNKRILANIDNFVSNKEKIDLDISSLEAFKKSIVNLYYDIILLKVDTIDSKYLDMFLEYFDDTKKKGLKYTLLHNKWKVLIRESGNNKKISFDKYQDLFEEMSKEISEEKATEYRNKFKRRLINYVLDWHLYNIKNNKNLFIQEDMLKTIFSYLDKTEISEYKEKEKIAKLKACLESDIKDLKHGISTIDIIRYQLDITIDKGIEKKITELLNLKKQVDQKVIIENDKNSINIDSILAWYDTFKKYLPELVGNIQNILKKVYNEWDSNRWLIESFEDIERALWDNKLDDSNIDNFIKALENYIDLSYINSDDISIKEKNILKKALWIIFSNIFNKDNSIRDTKKVRKFLERMDLSKKDILLLDSIWELEELNSIYPKQDLKYIHILLWIMNNILDINFSNEQKKIIEYTLLHHLIETVNNLDKKWKLSYEQSREIIDRINMQNLWDLSQYLDVLKNSGFVMMLKYY